MLHQPTPRKFIAPSTLSSQRPRPGPLFFVNSILASFAIFARDTIFSCLFFIGKFNDVWLVFSSMSKTKSIRSLVPSPSTGKGEGANRITPHPHLLLQQEVVSQCHSEEWSDEESAFWFCSFGTPTPIRHEYGRKADPSLGLRMTRLRFFGLRHSLQREKELRRNGSVTVSNLSLIQPMQICWDQSDENK